MKKHLFIIALIAFFGIFMSADADARGKGHYKHQYKEQKRINKAYRHGYYQGARHAGRYERRHRGYYVYNRPYRYANRPYRHHHGYYVPTPRPYVQGGISINIPLPPHPPLLPHP